MTPTIHGRLQVAGANRSSPKKLRQRTGSASDESDPRIGSGGSNLLNVNFGESKL